jgi:hypothetical protein
MKKTMYYLFLIISLFILGFISRIIINKLFDLIPLFSFFFIFIINYINDNLLINLPLGVIIDKSNKDYNLNIIYMDNKKSNSIGFLDEDMRDFKRDKGKYRKSNYDKYINFKPKETFFQKNKDYACSSLFSDNSKLFLNEFFIKYNKSLHLTPLEIQNIHIKLAKLNAFANSDKDIMNILPDHVKPFFETFLEQKRGTIKNEITRDQGETFVTCSKNFDIKNSE